MTKIVLNDVTNLNTLSVINDNFDKIEQELQNKVFYRNNPTGEPNGLSNDVDANGNSIYNVQDLTIDGAFTVQGQDVGSYIGQAAIAADDAQASATAAATSSANAQASADSALASKNTATTKASEASSSAASAASSASTATTQAGIATTGGSTATTQAGIATTQATIATTQAANAAASASTATTQAGISTTQATNSASSAAASAASAAAASAALDNFDDRYLGSKAVAPILDNDGDPLQAGELYYNNGTIVADDKGMWVYDGGTWIKTTSASQAILVTYVYVATGGQTTFSGADANALTLSYTQGSIFPTLNGTRLRPGVDYTASTGSTFVLSVAASAGDELVIDAFSTFSIAAVYTKAEADALLAGKLSTAAGAVGNTNLAANAVTLTKLAREGTTGQILTSNGAGADPSYQTMTNSYVGGRGQVFTSSGTFTIPTGITAVKVTVVGGGGGGGAGANNICGYNGGAGGGGGGAIKFLTGLTSGNTITVTVGAAGARAANNTAGGSTGGTSSVSSGTQSITTITCTGGVGGSAGNATFAVPRAGGSASGGDINSGGGASGGSPSACTGGNSLLGFGGATANSGQVAAVGNGGGGQGGYNYNDLGGAGTAGAVVFEW